MTPRKPAATPEPDNTVEAPVVTDETPEETTVDTEAAPATEDTPTEEVVPKTVSVRISGKRGKVTVPIDDEKVKTVSDAITVAAEQLGLNVDFDSLTIIVDGEEASAETPVEGATKIDAAPHASLG